MRSNHTVCVALIALLIGMIDLAGAARAHAQSDATSGKSVGATRVKTGNDAGESTAELAAAVHAGLPDGELDAVLVRLAQTPRGDALGLLEELSGHRRIGARRLAMEALEALAAKSSDAGTRAKALAVLARGLRDSDEGIRGIGAQALGRHGGAAHADVLLQALERGVPEVPRALGSVGAEALLPRVHAQLGVMPLRVMLEGYDAWLARKDVSEAGKLDIVARLGEVSGTEVKAFLRRLLAEKRFAKQASVQAAVLATEKRVAASGTSTSSGSSTGGGAGVVKP